jgi:Pectate lyase superfamily protein
MTSKTFISGTVIDKEWLNDVDAATYEGSAVYTPSGTGAVATTVQSKLRESVSVKDFGAKGDGTTDDTAAIQLAINNNNSVFLPSGTYLVSGTLSKTLTSAFSIYGAGIGLTSILKSGDSDLLVLTNTSGGGGQISIKDMTLAPSTAMTVGTAITVTNNSILPSLRVSNVFIGAAATNEFKFGIKAINCTESIFDRVVMYGLGTTNFTGWKITSTIAATVPKWTNCAIYNALASVEIQNTSNPGIEGVQFYGCEFVGVRTGLLYNNTVAAYAYFPPQILWSGGHINASYRNIDITTAAQIIINGSLFYNSGTTGQFINLANCSDLNIQGNNFANIGAGNCNGIAYSSGTTVNGGIIKNNNFSIGVAAAINMVCTNLQNLEVAGNTRIGAGPMVQTSGVIGNTVNIHDNSPKDSIEIYDLISVSGVNLSLVGLRSNFVQVNAPGSSSTVTSLTSRRSGETVTIKCDSANLTLQHNGINPDGFILKGATNFTFSSGSLITLYKGNGGYWTEVSRSV